MSENKEDFHVGLVGAGIGGLTAAIAIARAGARVTVLESAEELGEIGAGIQMTPNVARLLRRYGVDKAIGENLVAFKELNMKRKDGTKIGYTLIRRIQDTLGEPWWLVHRHHLHTGLVEVAREHGCEIHTHSRVVKLDYQDPNQKVRATTIYGTTHEFDLLIGSDGVNSIVRRTLFPDVVPTPPTNSCAFRAIVPYSEIRSDPDPEVRALVKDLTMEVWMADHKYIISYPISNGQDFNMVLSHHTSSPVSVVQDVTLEEVWERYKDFDPRIVKILKKLKAGIQRWPLLVTGPLPSWSSPQKNIVLIGDAAHSMTNHMAQGAATSMEDGAFLGVLAYHLIRGQLSLPQLVQIYEAERMPKAKRKQDVSFLNGAIWHLAGEDARKRDEAMMKELQTPDAPEGRVVIRSPNLYGDPLCVLEVYGYDAEAHAKDAVERFLNGGTEVRAVGGFGKPAHEQIMGWFLKEPERGDVSVPRSGRKRELVALL